MKPPEPGRREAAVPSTSGGRGPTLVAALMPEALALMTACGENGNGGEDTLLTGLSGLVILVLVVWLVVRAVKKRR